MLDRDALRGPLGVSLACAAGLVIVGLWLLIPVLGSMASLVGGDRLDEGAYEQLIAAHDTAHRTDLNRIHGRSFFFEPKAPPRPKPPEPTGACCVGEECTIMRRDACQSRNGRFQGADSTCGPDTCKPKVEPKPTETPKVDPRPKRYDGPDIIAIYGSDVFFRSPQGMMVIPVGREMDEIEVVSVNAPRSAELMWKKGGPFTVPLIDKPEDPWQNNPLRGVLELPKTPTIRVIDEGRPE
ncbi:MAG: hypothetical protein QF561_00500 [Phycisphaerales bacterium]|jgi:hypothetical protein|nr:hypothetical protein [Phycisphaerales bacterium]